MSFTGCIGGLMANSGLEKILKPTFTGVEKMLISKKYPMNLRARTKRTKVRDPTN